MKLTLELNIDSSENVVIGTADEIVVKTLKEDYESHLDQIRELENLADTIGLKLYQAEDLIHSQDLVKSIERLLRYYLAKDDADQYLAKFTKAPLK